MNNLIRSLLLMLFLGGMLFCYKDEPRKIAWENDNKTTALQQTFNERILFDQGQERMLRLEKSTNDDRKL